MRFIPLIILTIFSATLFAQEVTLSKEELKKFRGFEGNQVEFNYNDLVAEYIYSTQKLKQSSTNMTVAQVKIHAYIKLIKNDDEFCFISSDLEIISFIFSPCIEAFPASDVRSNLYLIASPFLMLVVKPMRTSTELYVHPTPCRTTLNPK